MPIVSSVTVTDRVQRDGKRKIRQIFTDHLGVTHPEQFLAAADYDAVQGLIDGAGKIEAELEGREEGEYREELIAGRNPFRNPDDSAKNPEFHTRTNLLRKIVRYFLKHEDPLMLDKLAHFLARVTDAQLKGLLGINQARVDRIRAKVTQVVAIRDAHDAFEPELGEDE